GKQVVIDKDKCIRCYCCHEMCPFDAIFVEKHD
ncbi:MAG: 4Fe-4S binding protein, partial [Spirochaetales bacterium]|nr:4Fe-4S binding protein [Candidatus Physcosoma equi]